jgi:hypothetical protein
LRFALTLKIFGNTALMNLDHCAADTGLLAECLRLKYVLVMFKQGEVRTSLDLGLVMEI